MERQILLHSTQYCALMAVAEVLRALLYPHLTTHCRTPMTLQYNSNIRWGYTRIQVSRKNMHEKTRKERGDQNLR